MATQRFFLRGDIDLATSALVQSQLDDLVATHPDDDVTLDCCGLTFLDSTGVAVIVRAQQALSTRGNELRVANADGSAARALDILGLTEVLHVNQRPIRHPDLIA